MKQVVLDTNVVLRLLLADQKSHHAKAVALFEAAAQGDYQMFMEPEILAECVFVLDSFYEIDRSEIATLLSRLLQHPGIRSGQMELLQVSLELFAQTNVDMADCLLAARSKVQGCAIATFDKDFKKLETIDLLEF